MPTRSDVYELAAIFGGAGMAIDAEKRAEAHGLRARFKAMQTDIDGEMY